MYVIFINLVNCPVLPHHHKPLPVCLLMSCVNGHIAGNRAGIASRGESSHSGLESRLSSRLSRTSAQLRLEIDEVCVPDIAYCLELSVHPSIHLSIHPSIHPAGWLAGWLAGRLASYQPVCLLVGWSGVSSCLSFNSFYPCFLFSVFLSNHVYFSIFQEIRPMYLCINPL